VYSSKSGRWPGSTQPAGERMWATLTRLSPVLTCPTYSSISFGLVPAASTLDGDSISFGIGSGYTKVMDGVPILRGVSHFWAFWLALSTTIPLVALATGVAARGAALVYGAGMCVLFAGSAAYHRYKCGPRLRRLLCRIDHSAIFVFIAASYTPVALLVLEPPMRTIVLVSVWAGAALGVALSLAWISAPRLLSAVTYLAVGWVAVIALPELLDRVGAAPLVLLVAGGALYSAGAIVYAIRKPNLWPRTFGFHEVFHALVIAAAAAHFIAMAGWVVPAAA